MSVSINKTKLQSLGMQQALENWKSTKMMKSPWSKCSRVLTKKSSRLQIREVVGRSQISNWLWLTNMDRL
jgi:hypothetical protein